MLYLKTRLDISMHTLWIGALLVMALTGLLMLFSRWLFRRSAREALSEH
jgi:hypothetical protein